MRLVQKGEFHFLKAFFRENVIHSQVKLGCVMSAFPYKRKLSAYCGFAGCEPGLVLWWRVTYLILFIPAQKRKTTFYFLGTANQNLNTIWSFTFLFNQTIEMHVQKTFSKKNLPSNMGYKS